MTHKLAVQAIKLVLKEGVQVGWGAMYEDEARSALSTTYISYIRSSLISWMYDMQACL